MRLRLSADAIERYRSRFLPETVRGIDVVDADLEDLIGRRLPAGVQGPSFEIELLETAIGAAQINLARALKTDGELNMLQQSTMDATSALASLAKDSVDVKQKLGMPGYEPLPEHKVVEQTNRNLSVELHGKMDPRTGKLGPSDASRVDLARELLAQGPDAARQMIEAAQLEAQRRDAVEGTAEDVTDDGADG